MHVLGGQQCPPFTFSDFDPPGHHIAWEDVDVIATHLDHALDRAIKRFVIELVTAFELSVVLEAQEVQHWLTARWATSAAQINSGQASHGNCDTFARAVGERLKRSGVQAEALWDVSLASFLMEDENDEAGRPLDRALLAQHWPDVRPTQDLTWADLERLSDAAGWDGGTHVWLTWEGRHYDSECLQGVTNFLELPFFERALKGWKAAMPPPRPRASSPRRSP
jgi:hypothetical protein